jgi:hypothetical protein
MAAHFKCKVYVTRLSECMLYRIIFSKKKKDTTCTKEIQWFLAARLGVGQNSIHCTPSTIRTPTLTGGSGNKRPTYFWHQRPHPAVCMSTSTPGKECKEHTRCQILQREKEEERRPCLRWTPLYVYGASQTILYYAVQYFQPGCSWQTLMVPGIRTVLGRHRCRW